MMSSKSDDPCSGLPDDCAKAASLVDLYIDGVLEVDDRTFIQKHLDGCPGCKGGYEFESAFHLRVRSLAPIYMPDEVKSHIMLALGFPGMSSPSEISSQMGIPRTEIPRGQIPKSGFFGSDDASSSED